MRVIDADGHVEEKPITFSDKYFAAEFRPHRPQVVPGTEEGLVYSMIDKGRVSNPPADVRRSANLEQQHLVIVHKSPIDAFDSDGNPSLDRIVMRYHPRAGLKLAV